VIDMTPESLPKALAELEDRLRTRPAVKPTAGLRDRVLRAAAASALPSETSSAAPWKTWYWAAIAAGILIVLNLSMISASHDEFSIRPAGQPDPMAAEMQALRLIEAQQEGTFK